MFNLSKSYSVEQIQQRISADILPVIITLGTFGIAGIFGNTFAIVYFAKHNRSSTMTFMLNLACADLVVCLLTISKCFELSRIVSNDKSVACRVTHFLAYWAINCSGFFLAVIAVDRFRKVCQPYRRQLTAVPTRIISSVVILLTCLIAVKNFVMTDIATVKLATTEISTNATGRYCTTVKRSKKLIAVFSTLDAVLVSLVWIVMIVCYSKIIQRLLRLKR